MKVQEVLAHNLLAVYEGGNWTEVCLSEILGSISWEQAVQPTPGSVNTIASLVHHLQYWNNIIRQRLQGQNPVIPEENGFARNTVHNENDWQEILAATHQSFLMLADAIRRFPDEKMNVLAPNKKASYAKNLFGIVEHAYYHLGQIVILRNFFEKAKS